MADYAVEMEHISKSFPGVLALDDVSFGVKPGEVMALLGENGAGKSTLMKVLSGVYTRDAGEIRLFGEPVHDISPLKAQALGISIIHQELNLCTHLTVAENIFLGRELEKKGFLASKDMNRRAREVLDRLNIDIDPESIVGNLAISKQQMVEIAKALSIQARVLIMDEPTSALTAKEIEDLFSIIRRLRDDGCAVVYISHRLDELQHIVDRVTIMRDGRFISCVPFAETTISEIISNMVGREITNKFPRVKCPKGEKVFEVKHLNAGQRVKDVSFSVYQGEIVGIAGLMGAGRTEMSRAIVGVDPKDSGEILLDGRTIDIRQPLDAIKAGVVLVPEDRKKDGLCTKLSIRENIALPNLDILCGKDSFVRKPQEAGMVQKAVENFDIRLSSPEMDAGGLSGGNQQKVVVGKWLSRSSRMIIFDEPTRGIDVAAKVEIYHLINELKQQGIGVFFISSEMPEILGFSDRILVMCDGRITGEFDAEHVTQSEIMECATMFEKKISEDKQ